MPGVPASLIRAMAVSYTHLDVYKRQSYPRIAGGMRLVEGVGSELLPVAPDLLQDLRIMSVLLSLLCLLYTSNRVGITMQKT